MCRIGLKNKMGKVSKKKIAAIVVAVVVLAGALWGGWQLLKGDTEVDFRVLSEAEIPQQIATQVIPQYRQLESLSQFDRRKSLRCGDAGKTHFRL